MNKLKLLLVLLLLPLSVFAQPDCDDLNWPDNPEARKELETNLARFSDLMKTDSFRLAFQPHQWLLEHHPSFNKLIYINGAKMLNGLIEDADDEDQKLRRVDSLLFLYDKRIEYCNHEADVSARKAYDAYRHTYRNKERLPDNLALFDKAFDLNGADIPNYMLLPYMNLVK